MPSPPISLFMTTIASQPVLRKKQEYVLRILQAKKIPFTTYDLASDEEAKRMWRRKAPPGKQQLPGMLVGGKFPGTIDDFEDAVEHNELAIFLRLNESWDPLIDEDRPMPVAKPVGIPGAYTPLQMTPEHLRANVIAGTPSASPLSKKKTIPINKRSDLINVGEDLNDFGLSGVQATMDELKDLLSELGLEGDAVGDLAKGLSNDPIKPLKFGKKPAAPVEEEEKSTPPASSSKTIEDPVTMESAPLKSVEQPPVEIEVEASPEKEEEKEVTEKAEVVKESAKEVPTTKGPSASIEIETAPTAGDRKEEGTTKEPKVEVEVESEQKSPKNTKPEEVPAKAEEEVKTPVKDTPKAVVEKIEELKSDKVPDIEDLGKEEPTTDK